MAEMKRSSLVDDSFETVGASKKSKKSSSGSGNGKKIAFVIFCFVVAGAGIAWNMGMFESAPKPPPRSAEDQKAATESQKASEVIRKSPKAAEGGS